MLLAFIAIGILYVVRRGGTKSKWSLLLVVLAGIGAIVLFGNFVGRPHGMAAVTNDTETYANSGGHPVDGAYSIEIDLSDLEGNLGKPLFDDGEHRIYVNWAERMEGDGVRFGFRSSGSYSEDGASLISGVRHISVAYSNTSALSAKAKVTLNGLVYLPTGHNFSGINYKDGDDFLFHFPMEGVTEEEQRNGSLTLTVTDLYRNDWSRRR
jgi:hypothetical protein